MFINKHFSFGKSSLHLLQSSGNCNVRAGAKWRRINTKNNAASQGRGLLNKVSVLWQDFITKRSKN